MAMQSAILFAAENKRLLAANERVKKKRQQKKSYINKGGVLNAGEVQEARKGVVIEEEARNPVVKQPNQLRLLYALRIYNICKLLAYIARICPERQ